MTNKEQIASKCECYIPETKSCSKTLSGSCRGEMCQTFNLINQLAQSAIEDYRQTIERLQQECTEKTNAIIALGEHLKAKEQECEKWKHQAELGSETTDRLAKQLEEKEQECEELKERLVRTEEDLKYQCVDCMNVKSDRYREALEEIEKVINNILNSCLGRNTVSCRPAHNVCGDLINILDIISRAKGEK